MVNLPGGKPQRPISMLYRPLAAQSVVATHSHGWGQLVYSYSGVLEVAAPGGRYLAPPDRAVWVPADFPHEVSSYYGAEVSSIYITVAESGDLPDQCRVIHVAPLLRELIIAALQRPADYDWDGADGRLFRTLRDQVVVAEPAPLYLPLPSDPRLQKICAQLQAQPDSKVTIAEWSQSVGASVRTLQRLFQKETRLNFQEWRQQLRLLLAQQRLAEGKHTITSIANDLGYESTSAFIAMFQKQVGITPGDYVKSLRKTTTAR